MRVTEPGFAILLVTCLVGSFEIPGFAQIAERAQASSAVRRVRVTINARPADARALDNLFLEWFRSSAPHLQLEQIEVSEKLDVTTPSREPDLLRIWIALQGKNRAQVYFADPAGERFFLRDVPLRNGLDEVGREQLAQVVMTSSLSFIEGRVSTQVELVQRSLQSAEAKLESAQPPALPRAALAPPTQQPHWYPRFGAYYTLGLEQVGVWRNGPGLSIGLARQYGQRRVIADVKAHYLWQVTVTTPDVLLSLRTLGARLTAGYEFVFADNWFGCELGVSIDIVNYQPHSNFSPDISLRRSANQWRTGSYLGARISHDFHDVLATFLAGVTIYEPHTQYAVLRNGQQQAQYSPFTAQPQAALEVSWR